MGYAVREVRESHFTRTSTSMYNEAAKNWTVVTVVSLVHGIHNIISTRISDFFSLNLKWGFLFKNHWNSCLHVFWHLNNLIFVLETSEKSGCLFAFTSNNIDVHFLTSIQTEVLICGIQRTPGTEITRLLLILLDIRSCCLQKHYYFGNKWIAKVDLLLAPWLPCRCFKLVALQINVPEINSFQSL